MTSSAYCQSNINKFDAKNKVFNGHVWIDTLHLTPAQKIKALRKVIYDGDEWVDTLDATPAQIEKVHNILNAKVLTKDHYFLGDVKNIGVRFIGGGPVKSQIYEGLPWGDDKDFKSILIDGDCSVEITAIEVNEKNVDDFRYHVIQNNTIELVGWTKPTVFKYTADHKLKYAYLGKFNYVPGQVLKVEIENIKNYDHRDAMIIDWRKVAPANVSALMQFIMKSFPEPDNGLISIDLGMAHFTPKEKMAAMKKIWYMSRSARKAYDDSLARDIKFHLADSLQNIDFYINNGKGVYNYKVSLKREIGDHTDSLTLGETNTNYDLYKEYWKFPGKYTVYFTPKIHKHGGEPVYLLHNLTTSISFTVLPDMHRKVSVSVNVFIGIVLAIILIAILVFIYYRSRQKRLLAAEAQNRQVASLQLKSIRAQLNPHFMFNALAGIQNLMNKNDIEGANKYLAKFARLTRSVLEESNNELITIEQEVSLLEGYLQMERLRFGFNYVIMVDEEIKDANIEIPSMLLQPFLENAVKHGVSALKNNGLININFNKDGKNLILKITDNGKGFGVNNTKGMGIKLSKNRINLFNSINKHTQIKLNISTNKDGTVIMIELLNLL